MRVLSLGAGVQSTTVYLMANDGELRGAPIDVAIFADTGWEPKAVYEHLAWLESIGEIPIRRVSTGNLRADALDPAHRFASMPLYVRNQQGKEGRARRQCTEEYKLKAIRAEQRRMLGVGPRDRIPPGTVECLLGISLDEVERMKPSRERWAVNRWPLVEMRMTRNDCLQWLLRHGYPIPPKSSCIGCPFHNNAYWREMRDQRPNEWADAVDFDDRIRADAQLRGHGTFEKYLHRSLIPLREVNLSRPEDAGQTSMFADECEGMCGV